MLCCLTLNMWWATEGKKEFTHIFVIIAVPCSWKGAEKIPRWLYIHYYYYYVQQLHAVILALIVRHPFNIIKSIYCVKPSAWALWSLTHWPYIVNIWRKLLFHKGWTYGHVHSFYLMELFIMLQFSVLGWEDEHWGSEQSWAADSAEYLGRRTGSPGCCHTCPQSELEMIGHLTQSHDLPHQN